MEHNLEEPKKHLFESADFADFEEEIMSQYQKSIQKKQSPVRPGPQARRMQPGIKQYKFIDLFAGVGGFRLAFEKAGGKCVFSSEWDKFAQKTYEANHGDTPNGDITQINAKDIPNHDILLGGFPCQPFSISGVSKKNALGREHGFKDKTQGTLFFDVARIIEAKRPQAFILENVKNLMSHDKGRTFAIILDTLEELGYHVKYQVLNAAHLVPQNRERVFLVGFRSKAKAGNFQFPDLEEIYQARPGARKKGPALRDILDAKVDPKYQLSDKLWNYLQAYKEKHRKAGHGFGFGMAESSGISRTLSARYYKDGSEILIPMGGRNPRRLTPRECARLQGFPEDFKIVCSDTQAYKQFGNSVAVPVIEALALSLKEALSASGRKSKSRSTTTSNVRESKTTGAKKERRIA